MADNFHQIYIHVVFAVSHRESAIGWEWANRLYKYIGGVLSRHNNTPIAINGMPDHLHVLFGLHPANSLSETIQQIKHSSSYWINHNHLAKSRFRWQAGYAAFSYSRSQTPTVPCGHGFRIYTYKTDTESVSAYSRASTSVDTFPPRSFYSRQMTPSPSSHIYKDRRIAKRCSIVGGHVLRVRFETEAKNACPYGYATFHQSTNIPTH